MAFVHVAGVTAAGAPDEVVDWFATFQAWMLSIGWMVEAGGGTEDITFRSLSEAGGLTMLYLRCWRDLGNVNRVYFRVQDDLAGTHVTTVTEGYVDSGGVQFAYWMSGDRDAIVVCFKLGAGYRHVYSGMVMPFALTVPDETYRMIVAPDVDGVNTTAILRNHDGLWDQDSRLYANPYMSDSRIDPFDGSFSLGGTYFGRLGTLAGQLKHISCSIQDAAINPEDTIDTGRPGATTSWIVLKDRTGTNFAIRTGGVLPAGIPDGTFASGSGVAVNYDTIYGAVAGVLVGLGWTNLGDPGLHDDGRLFFSQGESGEENIYVLFARAATQFYVYVQDDAVATHRTGLLRTLPAADFPVNYWIAADKDCVVLVVQRAGGYVLWWGGMVAPFTGGLIAPYAGPSLTEYSMVAAAQGAGAATAVLLRHHTGVWTPGVWTYSEGANAVNSNPNSFDGTTYLVWPFVAYLPGLPGNLPIGQMKYYFYSDGGGIASMDTITVGARVYTVFFDNLGVVFVLRTA